jgi:hypothetical protein
MQSFQVDEEYDNVVVGNSYKLRSENELIPEPDYVGKVVKVISKKKTQVDGPCPIAEHYGITKKAWVPPESDAFYNTGKFVNSPVTAIFTTYIYIIEYNGKQYEIHNTNCERYWRFLLPGSASVFARQLVNSIYAKYKLKGGKHTISMKRKKHYRRKYTTKRHKNKT